jgi:ankyrin repeat protein
MKHLLLTIIAAVFLVGCGESQQSTPQADPKPAKSVTEVQVQQPTPSPEAKTIEPAAEVAQPQQDAKLSNTETANKALLEAAGKGDSEAVKQHLAAGANVNVKRAWYGRTPLHIATWSGQEQIVQLLIEKGASVNAKDKGGWTPLYCAVESGYKNIVELLISNGAYVNATGGVEKESFPRESGFTALHKAAAVGHMEISQLLIAKGAKLNSRDSTLGTPLHSAAEWGQQNIVQLLIEKGVNVNSRDNSLRTPLHRATSIGQTATVKFLIGQNAETNAKDANGMTSLHIAAFEGNKECLEVLISKGANLNAASMSGETALHLAALKGHKEIVKFLISKNADANTKAEGGYTALDVSKDWARSEIITLLGGEINTDNKLKHSDPVKNKNATHQFLTEDTIIPIDDLVFFNMPIEQFLELYSNYVNRTLLQHKNPLPNKDINILLQKPLTVKTAIQAMNEELFIKGYTTIPIGRKFMTVVANANALKDSANVLNGLNLDTINRDQLTPLHDAASIGHFELVELLVRNGANVNAKSNADETPLDMAEGYPHTADLLRKHGGKTGEELKAEGK